MSAETAASEVGTWRETKPGYPPYPPPTPPYHPPTTPQGRGFSPSPPSATIQLAPQGRRTKGGGGGKPPKMVKFARVSRARPSGRRVFVRPVRASNICMIRFRVPFRVPFRPLGTPECSFLGTFEAMLGHMRPLALRRFMNKCMREYPPCLKAFVTPRRRK